MSVPISSDTTGEITQDDKTMAMLAYLLGIVTGFVGPLILYLVKKDQSKFVAFHSLQALIFHVVVNIAVGIAWALIVVLVGFVLAPIVGIVGLAYTILAALAANRGEWYEIPLLVRLYGSNREYKNANGPEFLTETPGRFRYAIKKVFVDMNDKS